MGKGHVIRCACRSIAITDQMFPESIKNSDHCAEIKLERTPKMPCRFD
jgi:hypothetical protein